MPQSAPNLWSAWTLLFLSWLPCSVARVPKVNFTVVETFQHQTRCFTEGLFLNSSRPDVFESCGLYGRSYLRQYDLRTGKTLRTAKVPAVIFSEGLALLGERLFMLTYRSRQVLEYDVRTFARSSVYHPFPFGEGWGLTTDGCDLLATTGSAYIFRLHPDNLGVLRLVGRVQVTHEGKPVTMLNELEYVSPKLWINQWYTNTIWRVDPITGDCELRLDIGGLHAWTGGDTPNGVAYAGKSQLLVTGKQWPKMFSLQLSQRDLCGESTAVPSCPQAPASPCWAPPPATVVLSAVTVPAGARLPAGAPVPAPQKKRPESLRPLPGGVTLATLVLALIVGAAAVTVPVLIGLQRHHYKLALQNVAQP